MSKIIDIANKVRAKQKAEQQKFQIQTPAGPINSPLILKALSANEDGDALLFIKLNLDKVCFDHAQVKWFRWNGHCWREDNTEYVNTCLDGVINLYKQELSAQVQIQKDAESKGNEKISKAAGSLTAELKARITQLHTLRRKKNVIKLSAMGDNSLGISGDQWDLSPHLFACKNGIIDLKSGDFRDGQPGDYIKTAAETIWKGINEPAPAWEQFLLDIFHGDSEMVAFMQRLLGYAITGLSTEHILGIFIGVGRNAKTTLLETVYHVIGAYGSPIESETLLQPSFIKSGSDHSADVMAFKGRRLIFSSETAKDVRLNESKVKLYTGGDSIAARSPHAKDMTRFQPTHKLFINTNHLPTIKDPTLSIWERIIPVEFPCCFINDPENPSEQELLLQLSGAILKKKDPGLKYVLQEEASGILAWLVRGSMAYFQNGLNIPDKVKSLRDSYRFEENSVLQFNTACLIPEKDKRKIIRAKVLYEDYLTFCHEGGISPEDSKTFGQIISKIYERRDDSRGRYYRGISKRSPERDEGQS